MVQAAPGSQVVVSGTLGAMATTRWQPRLPGTITVISMVMEWQMLWLLPQRPLVVKPEVLVHIWTIRRLQRPPTPSLSIPVFMANILMLIALSR